jgi:hypothetical protein
MAVSAVSYASFSTSITSHASSREVPALWMEHRSNGESSSRTERRNGHRMYARQREGETPAFSLEDVVRRQRRVIATLRHRIKELRECLAEMRRDYTEEDNMDDLVDNMETMHVDTR